MHVIGGFVTVLALAGMAVPAQGAVTVSVSGNSAVIAGGAEAEQLQISSLDVEGSTMGLQVAPLNGSLTRATAGAGCSAFAGVVRCSVPLGGSVLTTMGGGGDQVELFADPALSWSVLGEAGDDTLTGRRGSAQLEGGAGNDALLAGPGDDTLLGGTGNDQLLGEGGRDALDGGTGGDFLSGGDGVDQLVYERDGLVGSKAESRASGVVVIAGDGLCNDGGPEDALVGGLPPVRTGSHCADSANRDEVAGDFESIAGTSKADDIVGSAGGEGLRGGAGDDRLEGAGGTDSFVGGPGADLILSRDDLKENVQCDGDFFEPKFPGDRAVADLLDGVDDFCDVIERGGAGATGPAAPGDGAQPPAPPASAEGSGFPAPATAPGPAPAPASAVNGGDGAEGTGPGGGDAGVTPPEVQVVDAVALVSRSGRVALLIRCVYKAKACRGTVTLSTAARLGKLRKAKRVGRATLEIPWGRSERVSVPVSKAFRQALRRASRPARVKVAVAAADSGAGSGAAVGRASRVIRIG
ncbi:MAG: calcium-binding protein [Solirubrobacteraceae bacterium]